MPAFKAPNIRFGDIVAWYQNGYNTSHPHPAIVTSLGVAGMVNLKILPEGTITTPFMVGVRHAADPSAKEEDLRRNGSWETLDEYEMRVLERSHADEEKRRADQEAREKQFSSAMKPKVLQPA